MAYLRKVINKKSIIQSLIVLALLGGYYAFIYSNYEVDNVDNSVILAEIGAAFLVTLIRPDIPEKYQFYFNFIYVIILACFTALTLDFYNGTFESTFEESRQIILTRFFLSALIAALIYFLIIAFAGNMRIACSIGYTLFMIFALIGYTVYQFRGDRLLFSDLLAVETAMDVVGNYNTVPVERPLLLGFASAFCGIPTLCRIFKVKLSWKSAKRLICYLVFCFGFFGLYYSNFDNYFYSWQEDENSYIYSFFANLKFIEIKPDRNYEKEEVIKSILEAKEASILPVKFDPSEEIRNKFPEYVSRDKTTNPNIIVIMNESWADIDSYDNTQTNDQIFNSINHLSNTIRGETYVEVRGGGTADSEYSFLTGNSTAILPLNARPYQFYINPGSSNIVTYLDGLDYQTVAIHPGSAISWNRQTVYDQQFGFDEMIFLDQFEGMEYVRTSFLHSDFSTYQKIADKLNASHTKPYFVFDVTIQNHGGYSLGFENLPKVNVGGNLPDSVIEYLSLIKSSNDQFMKFINYLQSVNEPTIVLMFGDHQAVLKNDSPYASSNSQSNDNLSIVERQELYKTPYVIWANYTLPQNLTIDLSLNYLSTLLLECSGIKKPPLNNYLANLYKKVKVVNRNGIITHDNKYYSFLDEDIPEEYRDVIEEFKLFSYYNILEQKQEDFSSVKKE